MYDPLCLPNSYISLYTLTDYALTDQYAYMLSIDNNQQSTRPHGPLVYSYYPFSHGFFHVNISFIYFLVILQQYMFMIYVSIDIYLFVWQVIHFSMFAFLHYSSFTLFCRSSISPCSLSSIIGFLQVTHSFIYCFLICRRSFAQHLLFTNRSSPDRSSPEERQRENA